MNWTEGYIGFGMAVFAAVLCVNYWRKRQAKRSRKLRHCGATC